MARNESLTIRLAAEGGERVKQDLRGVGLAAEENLGLIVAAAKEAEAATEKWTATNARSLSSLIGKYDPLSKQMADIARQQDLLDKAQRVGAKTAEDLSRVTGELSARKAELMRQIDGTAAREEAAAAAARASADAERVSALATVARAEALDMVRRQYDPAYASAKRYEDETARVKSVLDAANASEAERASILRAVANAYDPVARAANETATALQRESAERAKVLAGYREQAALARSSAVGQARYSDFAGVRDIGTGAARQSAAVFEAEFEREAVAAQAAAIAAKDLAAAEAKAAQAAQVEAAAIQQLRDRIDPAAAAQRALSAETARMSDLLARGKISHAEYAAGIKLAEAETRRLGAATGMTYQQQQIMQAGMVNTFQSLASGAPLMQTLVTQGTQMIGVFGMVNPIMLGAAGGVLALGAGAMALGRQMVIVGDAMTMAEGRIKALTGSAEGAKASMAGLHDIGMQTGVAVQDSAKMFGRFTMAAEAIGATRGQVLQLTEIVQKFGIISGASTQEATSGAIQLGQALASGRLQGDELRSVLENMPLLAKAIADGLGVGVGKLREMAAAGDLTAEKVFAAILSQGGKANEMFAQLPGTVERASGQMGVAWDGFIARLNESLGVTKTLAHDIQFVADLIDGMNKRATDPKIRVSIIDQQISDLKKNSIVAAPRDFMAWGLGGKTTADHIADLEQRKAAILATADAETSYRQSLEKTEKQTAETKKVESDRLSNLAASKKLILETDAAAKALDERDKKLTQAQNLFVAGKAGGGVDEATYLKVVSTIEAEYAAAIDKTTGAKKARTAADRDAAKSVREAAKADDDWAKVLLTVEGFERDREKAVKDATASIQGQIDGIREETYQLGLSDKDRELRVEMMKAENAAKRANIDLTPEQIDAIKREVAARGEARDAVEAQESREKARVKAVEDAQRQIERAVEHTTDRITDAAADVLFSGKSAAEQFKELWLQAFREIAANAIIRPTVQPIVQKIVGSAMGGAGGGLESLFGSFGGGSIGAAGNAGAALAGQAGGGSYAGALSSYASAGSSAYSLYSGGSGGMGGGMMASAELWGATNLGTTLSMETAGQMAAQGLGTIEVSSSGSMFVTEGGSQLPISGSAGSLGTIVGAAGLGYFGSSLLANTGIGFSAAPKTYAAGGAVAAGAGAAIGGVYGAAVAWAAYTVATGIMRAFGLGKKKKADEPINQGNFSVSFGSNNPKDNYYHWNTYGLSNTGSLGPILSNMEAVAKESISSLREFHKDIGVWAAPTGKSIALGGLDMKNVSTETLQNWLADATRRLAVAGSLRGDNNVVRAAANSSAVKLEDFLKDLDFAKSISDAAAYLKNFKFALSDIEKQARAAATQGLPTLLDELERAEALKIDDSWKAVNTQLMKITMGTVEFKDTTTQSEKALAAITGQFAGFRDVIKQTGMSITEAEVKAAEAQARQRLRDGFNQGLSAQYLQLTDPKAAALGDWSSWADNLRRETKAVGGDLVLAEKLIAAKRLEVLKQFETQAAQTEVDRQKMVTDAVGGLRSFISSLKYSDLSALTPEQKWKMSKQEFQAVAGAAVAGNFESLTKFQDYASNYLTQARDQYGSGAGYAAAFSQVLDFAQKLADKPMDGWKAVAASIETTAAQTNKVLRDELTALRQEVTALRADIRVNGIKPVRAA